MCVYICVCMCIYIYTHTQTQLKNGQKTYYMFLLQGANRCKASLWKRMGRDLQRGGRRSKPYSDMYPNVHSSTVYVSQDMEAT